MYENFISHSSESFLFNFYTYEGRQELYRAVCEKLAEQEEEERQDRLTQLRDRLAEQEEEEEPKKLSKGQKKKLRLKKRKAGKKKGAEEDEDEEEEGRRTKRTRQNTKFVNCVKCNKECHNPKLSNLLN